VTGRSTAPELFLALLAVLAWPAVPIAAEQCEAEVDVFLQHETTGEREGQEVQVLHFEVEVAAGESYCAAVNIDLVIHEITDEGEEVKTRALVMKVKDQTLVREVRHIMPTDRDLGRYDAEIKSCRPCEPGD
jgi:hypothetical protein